MPSWAGGTDGVVDETDADLFGASGVFDDLRDSPRDGFGSPRHGR